MGTLLGGKILSLVLLIIAYREAHQSLGIAKQSILVKLQYHRNNKVRAILKTIPGTFFAVKMEALVGEAK
jgi:hypothetical protein